MCFIEFRNEGSDSSQKKLSGSSGMPCCHVKACTIYFGCYALMICAYLVSRHHETPTGRCGQQHKSKLLRNIHPIQIQ